MSDQPSLFHEDAPNEDVKSVHHDARTSWLVRVHPFQAFRKLQKSTDTEAEVARYIEWLKRSLHVRGSTIVVEKNGVLWTLWECEGREWKESVQHD